MSQFDTDKALVRFAMWLKFGACIGVVVGIPAFTIPHLWKQQASLSWPTVDGEIRGSDLSESWNSRGTTYRWRVRYHYVVDGTPYSGSTYSGPKGSEPEAARRYPVGSSIAVRYSPTDASVSSIGPGPRWIDYTYYLLGWLGAGAFAVALWFVLRSSRSE